MATPSSEAQLTDRSAQCVADYPLVFSLPVKEAGLDDLQDRIDEGPQSRILFFGQSAGHRSQPRRRAGHSQRAFDEAILEDEL